MIKINVNNIEQICTDFSKKIFDSALKRAEKVHLVNRIELDDETLKLIKQIYGTPFINLVMLAFKFRRHLGSHFTTDQIKKIRNIYFDYESLLDYPANDMYGNNIAYWLMKKLNVTVCPYCNRNYTNTIKGARPQFDHFFCQKRYPDLQVSFYNLIPSCPICNHIKMTNRIKINPYIADFGDCKFHMNRLDEYMKSGNSEDIDIDFINIEDKYKRNIKIFKLKDFYNCHKDYASEIIDKAQKYNDVYFNVLQETFKDIPKERLKILAFGNYINSEDLCKRPLAKLTKDIIEQIET